MEQRVSSAYQSDARRFAQQAPDFPAAYQHLLSQRVAELQAQGYQEAAIADQLRREEFGIASAALQAGRSPAEQVYALAKARGYVPATQRPADAAPAAAPDPALQEARSKAAKGISDGGAAPKTGAKSLEEISRLSGAAFDSAFEKWEKENSRRSSLFRRN